LFLAIHPNALAAASANMYVQWNMMRARQCVEWCPEQALVFITEGVLAQKARISATKRLFQKALIVST
jgi:Fe-S-cluster-containing hydrogenase component 2